MTALARPVRSIPGGARSQSTRLVAALTTVAVGLMLVGTSGAAHAAPTATAVAPNWPGGQCVLSSPHVVFDDETAHPKATMSWNASAATPVDPSDANFHLRTIDAGIANLSAHTYYETTYFISWFYLYEEGTTKYNYAPWDPTAELFDTQVPPSNAWVSGWEPRDIGTPGAQSTLETGSIASSPLSPVIISPETLGKTGLGTGATRPGYVVPDILPGADQDFTQILRIERPTNNGAYAFLAYRVVSAKTCLPVPTIVQATVGDSVLHGTGTTVGDVITVTDQGGNTLGTAVVQSDLTWSLTLSAPLASTVTSLTASEVDEFDFQGQASTTVAAMLAATGTDLPILGLSALAAAVVLLGAAAVILAAVRRRHNDSKQQGTPSERS